MIDILIAVFCLVLFHYLGYRFGLKCGIFYGMNMTPQQRIDYIKHETGGIE